MTFSDSSVSTSRDGSEKSIYTRRIRLLVVDENETARTAIARRLDHLNYDVTLAESGFLALNHMVGRPYEMILVDMGMKALSGIDTIRKIRGSGLMGNACVIAIASRNEGHTDGRIVTEALEAGADDIIAKPFDFEELNVRIRHCVERARRLAMLAENNAALDARIARRAMELGETRAELEAMKTDRQRLVTSIRSLHDEIERLSAHA